MSMLMRRGWINLSEDRLNTLMDLVFPVQRCNTDNDWVETRRGFEDDTYIEETEKESIVRVAAPGIPRDAFKITLEKRLLSISYDVRNGTQDNTQNNRSNKFCQSYNRSWTVPEGTTKKDLTASYRDGILVVRVAKQEPVKIPVETIEVK